MKEVFKRHLQLRNFVEPLIVIPFGWWGIYWFENGFSWIVAVIGIILFFVILPVFIVFRKK